MSDGHIEITTAAPGLVGQDQLKADRQIQFAGERGTHDDEGQAVAGARIEGLRRIACHGGIVLEAQLPLAVECLDEAELASVDAQLVGDVLSQIAPHGIA